MARDNVLFPMTSQRVAWRSRGEWRYADVCKASDDVMSWDNAAPGTTGALYLETHDVYAYVQIDITGRLPRAHAGGGWGTKARIRFTGPDDSGEWFDAVVKEAR